MHVIQSDLDIQLFVVLPKHLSLLLFGTSSNLQTDLSILLAINSILRTNMLRSRHYWNKSYVLILTTVAEAKSGAPAEIGT